MNWEKLNMSQRSELMSIYLKNGITSLDEMKKHYNSFAEGGSIDDPPPEEYEKYKYGIPTAEETDNRLYQSSFGTMLPEVKVSAKGDPRKVNNDYYKAHSRARTNIQEAVQTAPGWQLATLGAMAPAAYMLAPIAYAGMTNPLVDAALTTHGAITAPKNIREGISEIKEGNYSKGALDLGLTTLDLLGAGNLIGRPARLLSKNFRRNLAYRTIYPYEYSFSPEEAKDVLKGIWNKHYSPEAIQNVHENRPLRAAAFRKYLGLEDDITKKLFVPRSDGTFNIDPETAIALNKNVGINTLTGSQLHGIYKGHKRDYIYDIMGGLGGSEVYSLGNRGVFRMTDTWDLQPFKKMAYSPKFRLAQDIENLGTNIRQYTYDKSILKPLDKLAEKMQYATDYIKGDKSANSWLRNLEMGPILGGKPFNIDARIPFNINGGFPVYDASANIPSLEQAIMTKGDKVVFRRVKEPFEQFADGGKIFIKPENRGKFTALKKRTGHSASWFKENGTPAQRKMAVFELNSKKWRK